jgi:hypothetical protein
VEKGEKRAQLPLNTIHQSHERQHLCQQFMLQSLLKTYVGLYGKCSPIAALQLWYSKFLEFCLRILSKRQSNMGKRNEKM